MSGPKTSHYTLTPAQRRALEEQRKLERRKAIASETIKKAKIKLKEYEDKFDKDKAISDELLKRDSDNGNFSVMYDSFIKAVDPIKAVLEKTNMNDLASLEASAKTINEGLQKTEKIFREASSISAKNECRLNSMMNASLNKGFKTSFADFEITDEEILNIKKDELLEQLIEVKNIGVLPKYLLDKIEDTITALKDITDKTYLKNFNSLNVMPLLKKCNDFSDEFSKYSEVFEKLHTEYLSLCQLYGYEIQEYYCSSESITALENEIQLIKDAVSKSDEQNYIRECIDEVMVEMGYSVLGNREVIKKNGTHFRNELYSYEDGTAINITYSSDGKIAMELGGIDTTDRLPNKYETKKLCEAMTDFCDDFDEFEKRLSAKGVVLNRRISHLPVSEEYAQIINVSDYQMRTEDFVNISHKEKRRANTQKRKAMKTE